MNPYLASLLAEDRLSTDRLEAECHRPAAHSAGPAGPPRRVRAAGPPRRVRRVAGWLLIEAGLRLAVGRRPAALRG